VRACCLFNDAVTMLYCMASYDRMIGDQSMGKNLEKGSHDLIQIVCRHCLGKLKLSL
jgi:hypothetical protein